MLAITPHKITAGPSRLRRAFPRRTKEIIRTQRNSLRHSISCLPAVRQRDAIRQSRSRHNIGASRLWGPCTMPDDYETSFTVRRPPGLTGPAHLEDITRQTLQLLEESATGHPSPEVQSGWAGDTAYAIISATRQHQSLPEHTVQLEVGICTACQSLAMQIRTRFISPHGTGPPQIPAGPPRPLSAIAASNHCCADATELTLAARILDDEQAADFAASRIFNKRRTLTILLVSPYHNSDPKQYAASLQ